VPDVTCPFCFTRTKPKSLFMRCAPICGSDGTEFAASSLGRDGLCPHGQRPQARRLCPECRRDLLREYVEGDHRMIAMIGDQASGKSTYVGVLVHELQRQVGERFNGLALDLLGEESRGYYERSFGAPLYQQQRTPQPTRARRGQMTKRHDPLMFALRFPRHRRIPGIGGDPRTALTIFYDTAGEDSLRPENMEFLTNYLGAASGVLLVVDAGTLVGASPEASRTGRDPIRPVHVLAEHLRETSRRPRALLKMPLAVVITKIDLIREDFETTSALRRESRHDGYFDDADSREVHEELRSWLGEQGLLHVDRSIATNFETHRWFGVSALGHAPTGGDDISAAGIRPYRVEDPMLWLLARFGAVKMNGGRR
jgi:GTPase SAR1 family protein